MDDEGYWDAVRTMRLAVADFLSELTEQEWDAESLCPGWQVRDVAGHLSLVPTLTLGEMVAVAPRAGFNPHRINTLLARRYGSAPSQAIVERIRAYADRRTTARGLDTANSLFDLVVHAQDIAVPLGRTFEVPTAYAVAGLERVWSMGWPFKARRRLGHLSLRADDGAWAVGSGPEVRGRSLDLLLLLTGRVETAAPRLSGPGVAQLR